MASKKQVELKRLVNWFQDVVVATKDLTAGKIDGYDPNLPDFSVVKLAEFEQLHVKVVHEFEQLHITNDYIRTKLQKEIQGVKTPLDLYCYALCNRVKYEQQVYH